MRQREIDRAVGRATPRPSPSKQSTGSSAIFHSSASWSSVNAVPSGATAAS
jgi:hypothetical protein